MTLADAFGSISATQYPLIMGLLVLVDFVTGVLSAWRRGVFDWAHLADIFPHNVLTMLMATAAQVLSASQAGQLDTYLTPAIFAVFAATLAKSIFDNVQEVLATLPKPAPPAKPA